MRKRLCVLLLSFTGLLVYFNSLKNGFVGDDITQIATNDIITSFSNITSFFVSPTFYSMQPFALYYRPLMLAFYTAIYTAFNLNASAYHIVQLYLHIGNGILLYFILRYFVKNTTAFFVALLFLIHPINNETVAYIADLQDVLFVFFGLSGLLLLMRTKTVSLLNIISLSFFFLFSLFSKETGILFVCMTLAFSFLFAKVKLKLAGMAGIIAVSIYLFFRVSIAHIGYSQEEAIAPIAHASLFIHLITIPAILSYYVGTFFFPVFLSIGQFWVVRSIDLTHFFLPSLLIIVFLVCGALAGNLLKKNKKAYAFYFFFFGWTWLGLLFHAQIIPLEATVADRWFYFSSIGLLTTLGIICETLPLKSKAVKHIGIGLLILLCVLLSLRTIIRNNDWYDSITLYSHDLKVAKGNFFLQDALAVELIKDKRYTKAEPLLLASVASYPYAENVSNLAVVEARLGKVAQARYYWTEELRHTKSSYSIYQNYADFLLVYDTPENCIAFVKKALLTYPQDPVFWVLLAAAEYKMGDKTHAVIAITNARILANYSYIQTVYTDITQNKPIDYKALQ